MPTIKINDINLFYEIEGQGEPVLFLHGLGSSTIDWEYQIPYFSKHYQTITLDMRGHGNSDKPLSSYSISLFAQDAAKFIQKLDLGRATNIVGISMGGMIGLQLAADYPMLIKTLVVVNSAAEFKLISLNDHLNYLKRKLIVRFVGMRKMGEVIASKMFPGEHFEETREIFADRWAKNDKKAYLNSMNAIVNWSIVNELDNIICPTLVLTADQDYTPIDKKEALAKEIINAELLIITDSRHATPIDQVDKFNSAVHGFLEQFN